MGKTEIFVEKAKIVHGNKYDYSKVSYINRIEKIEIICNDCNETFLQSPFQHLKGYRGCKCSIVSAANKLKLSREDFEAKVYNLHGDKYDLALVENWSRRSKQTIICPHHGEFEIVIGNLLNGNGCKKCGIVSSKNKQLRTLEEFAHFANLKHANTYTYLEYNGTLSKAKILCSKHGPFHQMASYHLSGGGCPQCAIENKRNDDFVDCSKQIHGDKYDYSSVEYISNKTKVEIICQKHGKFLQEPHQHLSGQKCNLCAIEESRKTFDDFVSDANTVHDNKYEYTEYHTAHSKVDIICPKHGKFSQKPNNHLNGQGCPKCVISKPQLEIAGLIGRDYVLNDRKTLAPYEIDVFVPELNFGIEYHGLYWHSYDRPETTEERLKHFNKCSKAIDKGIRLFQIFEHHWLNKREIVLSMVNNILNKSIRVFARKTEVVFVSNEIYKEFMNNNHLYGSRSAKVKIGLGHNGDVIACMSFHKNKDDWEITRYACKKGFVVIGGVSKLLKFFSLNYCGDIITFADRAHSVANAYKKVGFTQLGTTRPNYFYTKNGSVFSRQQFQKHKLKNKLELFDANLTESQNMFNNGYRRIWDAGHFKLKYRGV